MNRKTTMQEHLLLHGRFFHWLRKPPALPVEVPRKKALASSPEQSELRIAIHQFRLNLIKTTDVRLRAVEHLMQVKDNSAHL